MSDRKARLAALAAKAGRTKNAAQEEPNGETRVEDNNENPAQQRKEKPSLKFRNYTPADGSLEEIATTSSVQPSDGANKRPRLRNDEEEGETTTTLAAAPSSIAAVSDNKSALERALEKARAEMAPELQPLNQAVSSSSVVPMGKPKKINWDLKRGIQTKLDKLEKRTQKAIVALLKERLEKDAAEVGDGTDDLD